MEALVKTATFLQPWLPLANLHNTDFILDDHWAQFLPQSVAEELDHMTASELSLLPSGKLYTGKTLEKATQKAGGETASNLEVGSVANSGAIQIHEVTSNLLEVAWGKVNDSLRNFAMAAHQHTLPNLDVVQSREAVQDCLCAKPVSDVASPSESMSEKKVHEVKVMTQLCACLAAYTGVKNVSFEWQLITVISCSIKYFISRCKLHYGQLVHSNSIDWLVAEMQLHIINMNMAFRL